MRYGVIGIGGFYGARLEMLEAELRFMEGTASMQTAVVPRA